MLEFIKAFWRTISSIFLLFSIFQLPKSISDLDVNAAPWKKALSLVDQNSALWLFTTCLVAYVLWVDVRPSVRKWLHSRNLSVEIQDEVLWESQTVDNVGNKEPIYINRCFLIVSNKRPDGRTLRNLRVTIWAPFRSKVQSQTRVARSTEIDLQHGEVAEFDIGMIAMPNMLGLPISSATLSVSQDQLKAIRHNVPKGYFSFNLSETLGISAYPVPRSWDIWAIVSADDVPSVEVKIELSLSTLDEPVKIISVETS